MGGRLQEDEETRMERRGCMSWTHDTLFEHCISRIQLARDHSCYRQDI